MKNQHSKPRLNVRQPDIIRPAVAIDRNRMAAAVVSAVNQHATPPWARMSAKVILVGRAGSGMAHD